MNLLGVCLLGERCVRTMEEGREGRGRGMGTTLGIGHPDIGVLVARNSTVDVQDIEPVVNPIDLGG